MCIKLSIVANNLRYLVQWITLTLVLGIVPIFHPIRPATTITIIIKTTKEIIFLYVKNQPPFRWWVISSIGEANAVLPEYVSIMQSAEKIKCTIWKKSPHSILMSIVLFLLIIKLLLSILSMMHRVIWHIVNISCQYI